MVAYASALAVDERWGDAEKALAEADRLEPNRWGSLQLRGILAIRQEKLDLALALLKRSLAINPSDPITHYHLGMLYKRQGDMKAALEALRGCVRLSPPASLGADAQQAITELTQ